MAEALKKKLRDRRYRTAFADAVLDDSIVLQIKTLRENRGFSQEELGRRAGMKQGAISRIESSDYGAWSVSTLKRIAKELDLPLSLRFVSWGNLLETAAHFTPAHLDVPPFDQDPAFLPVSDTTYVMDSTYLCTAIQRELRAFEHSLISEGWNQ